MSVASQQLALPEIYASGDEIEKMRRILMDVGRAASRAVDVSPDCPGRQVCLEIAEAVPAALSGLRLLEP